MKIRLLTTMAGPKGTGQPGQVVEVSEEQGKELVAGNFAVSAESAKAETAAVEPVAETASVAPNETKKKGR